MKNIESHKKSTNQQAIEKEREAKDTLPFYQTEIFT